MAEVVGLWSEKLMQQSLFFPELSTWNGLILFKYILPWISAHKRTNKSCHKLYKTEFSFPI